ncbi:MAG: HAD family hydrolase [Sphingomonadaceae bacterium]|nr:HAD family hydrolase [Novosphingobium sp.]MCB2084293.1 HAD family hydrolase [Sphingomonadaceae bacterium]
MTRPLVISDCDEVLLHMIGPFSEWLGEQHGIDFSLAGNEFHKAMTRRDTGERVEAADVWPLLNGFFDNEMHRQFPIAGSVEAIAALSENADVVVLTNLQDHRADNRTRQLADHGINLRVFTNQGPKGPALQAILDEYAPSRAVFIDDLAQHHGSVAEIAPHVDRLHLCGEPRIAPHIACAHEAGHAHARIDTWDHALPWLLERLHGETGENQ